ncbi:hypothetical protein DFH06DRAFT_1122763 [Mycena polygramma]|nr:hypothetical protein DFH06DRAFT_1122763 [Mycena polygramma]
MASAISAMDFLNLQSAISVSLWLLSDIADSISSPPLLRLCLGFRVISSAVYDDEGEEEGNIRILSTSSKFRVTFISGPQDDIRGLTPVSWPDIDGLFDPKINLATTMIASIPGAEIFRFQDRVRILPTRIGYVDQTTHICLPLNSRTVLVHSAQFSILLDTIMSVL